MEETAQEIGKRQTMVNAYPLFEGKDDEGDQQWTHAGYQLADAAREI